MTISKRITHLSIENLKPQKKQFTFLIETGLQLLIKPNGSKLWQHRYSINGKRKIFSLGKFPEISLSDAKELHFENCKLIANGIDPMELKKELAEQKEREKQKNLNKRNAVLNTHLRKWRLNGIN